MINTKNLILAAVAALTLGAATAQAQNLVPGDYHPDRNNYGTTMRVPSGSSDMTMYGTYRTAPRPQRALSGGDGGAG